MRMIVDYVKRYEGVVIPCRPNSDSSVNMESDLRSKTVRWRDWTGRDLPAEGHFKVDAEKRLVVKSVREMDAGIYVCTVSKVTSGDVVKVVRNVVRLNGIVTR